MKHRRCRDNPALAIPTTRGERGSMRSKFIAAVVSIVALAMPATAMAAGGGSSPAQSGGSGSAEKGVPVQTLRVSLALGSGYERRGGSQMVRSLQRRLTADGF